LCSGETDSGAAQKGLMHAQVFPFDLTNAKVSVPCPDIIIIKETIPPGGDSCDCSMDERTIHSDFDCANIS